jgi:hypothetical protein
MQATIGGAYGQDVYHRQVTVVVDDFIWASHNVLYFFLVIHTSLCLPILSPLSV